jgi:hypothetical protein
LVFEFWGTTNMFFFKALAQKDRFFQRTRIYPVANPSLSRSEAVFCSNWAEPMLKPVFKP